MRKKPKKKAWVVPKISEETIDEKNLVFMSCPKMSSGDDTCCLAGGWWTS